MVFIGQKGNDIALPWNSNARTMQLARRHFINSNPTSVEWAHNYLLYTRSNTGLVSVQYSQPGPPNKVGTTQFKPKNPITIAKKNVQMIF